MILLKLPFVFVKSESEWVIPLIDPSVYKLLWDSRHLNQQEYIRSIQISAMAESPSLS